MIIIIILNLHLMMVDVSHWRGCGEDKDEGFTSLWEGGEGRGGQESLN